MTAQAKIDRKIEGDIQGPWVQAVLLAFSFLFAAVGVLAVIWLISNIREVPPDARAAVLRFGTLQRIQASGLLLAWPRPFEEVVLLPSQERSIELRISRLDAEPPDLQQSARTYPINADPRLNIAFFLTGDPGVVHLGATAFYRVTDPAAYLLVKNQLDIMLERLVIASAVAVSAARSLDSILVTGPQTGGSASREQLRAEIIHEANHRLNLLAERGDGFGVDLTRIDLSANLPGAAKTAFDQVLVASQEADNAIARARTEAESLRQRSDQDRDTVVEAAKATAEERLSQARSRTAEISALAHAPHAVAGSMIDRLYYERIGKILGQAHRVDTFDPAGAERLILPGAGQ